MQSRYPCKFSGLYINTVCSFKYNVVIYTILLTNFQSSFEGAGDTGLTYKPVAVVRKDNTNINSLEDLEGAKSCHTGVGRAAGWVYPVAELISKDIMSIEECNVPVKSADAFFESMCAPGGLARFYNPFGKFAEKQV